MDCNIFLEKPHSLLQGFALSGQVTHAINRHQDLFDISARHSEGAGHDKHEGHSLHEWIVQKARPVMIEAIARQYLTGSMWRAYEKGEREFSHSAQPASDQFLLHGVEAHHLVLTVGLDAQ